MSIGQHNTNWEKHFLLCQRWSPKLGRVFVVVDKATGKVVSKPYKRRGQAASTAGHKAYYQQLT